MRYAIYAVSLGVQFSVTIVGLVAAILSRWMVAALVCEAWAFVIAILLVLNLIILNGELNREDA